MKSIPLSHFCYCLLFAALIISLNCNKGIIAPDQSERDDPTLPPEGTTPIEASIQRTSGDAAEGWDYLRYGNYIGAGIPYNVFVNFLKDEENVLERTGDNAVIPAGFNAFTTENGAKVVGGLTCFGCHATKLNDQFIPGLGDSFSDFTNNTAGMLNLLSNLVKTSYGEDSPEWEAFNPLLRGANATEPYTKTPFIGVNPAFMLEQAAVAHRNPLDLNWRDETYYPIPNEVIASDVPPLWNVKKKNALYYNGMGRGDFTKLLMQVMVVAIDDSTNARKINDRFDDVLAWIENIEPPSYPQNIDSHLAAKGEKIFNIKCQECHGSYGTKEEYPNLLVNLDKVGTDPAYANYFMKNIDFSNWFNESWMAQTEPKAKAMPSAGYVAPPLDGIWATAPYLHNGSVPTLEDLLKSSQRPTYWRRSLNSSDYDFEKVGWKYTVETKATDKQTYNTTTLAYGNQGHTFGDSLNDEDRKALIEYLKTL